MKTYKATTQKSLEGAGTVVLGYATGREEDIKAFFDDQKMYTVDLTEVDEVPNGVLDIGFADVQYRQALLREKRDLETMLSSVKDSLRNQFNEPVSVSFTLRGAA